MRTIKRYKKMTAFFIVLFTSLLVWTLTAGDLDPPGPPEPTMKTLDQVEPRIPVGPDTTPGDADSVFRISQPGSYYLTRDVYAVGEHGIEIAADDVTLDLMGYRIWSSYPITKPPENLDFDGIYITDNGKDVEIRNGIIYSDDESGNAGFRHGIFSPFSFSPSTYSLYLRISNVRVFNSRQYGIMTNGYFATIQACHSAGNGNTGIAADAGVVSDCVSRDNTGTGISGSRCVVVRNKSTQNTGVGIYLGSQATASENCVSLNSGVGIEAGSGSTVCNNSVYGNYDDGITASSGTLIRDNSVNSNYGNGIYTTDGCRIVNNVCRGNGYSTNDGAGIYVDGTDNQIEGNQVTINDRGIDVYGSGNMIVKNSAFSNPTNYVFVAGNDYGTIRTSLTTAGPWDNFSF